MGLVLKAQTNSPQEPFNALNFRKTPGEDFAAALDFE